LAQERREPLGASTRTQEIVWGLRQVEMATIGRLATVICAPEAAMDLGKSALAVLAPSDDRPFEALSGHDWITVRAARKRWVAR
jgi:hypothetical protein